jgi:hypothetical protein
MMNHGASLGSFTKKKKTVENQPAINQMDEASPAITPATRPSPANTPDMPSSRAYPQRRKEAMKSRRKFRKFGTATYHFQAKLAAQYLYAWISCRQRESTMTMVNLTLCGPVGSGV